MRKYIAIVVCIYLYIFCVLLSHNHTWMNIETAVISADILKEPTLSERFLRIFDFYTIENLSSSGKIASRARLFSHIFFVSNVIFRNFLFHFIPPHPSLSITWIIALLITPFFLYKLVNNLFENKALNIIAVGIYISLPGTLIPIMMNHRPDKTLSNFCYVICLYFASEIYKNLSNSKYSDLPRDFTKLIFLIAGTFLFDEYCLFIFFLVPIIFPRIFDEINKKSFFYVLGYLSLPLYYFLLIKYFLPIFYLLVGHPGFNFFGYVDVSSPFAFDFFNVVINFFLLLHDNLLVGFSAYLRDPSMSVYVSAFDSLSNQLVNGHNIVLRPSLLADKYPTLLKTTHNFIILTFFLTLFVVLLRPNKDSIYLKKKFLTRSFLSLIAYTLFFSILHVKSNILSGCGWYGCNFSLLFVLLIISALGILFESSLQFKKILIIIVFCSLTINSLVNVKMLNHAWKALAYQHGYWQLDMWLNKIPRDEFYQKYYKQNPINYFEISYKSWNTLRFPWSVKTLLDYAPEDVRVYLYVELSNIQ